MPDRARKHTTLLLDPPEEECREASNTREPVRSIHRWASLVLMLPLVVLLMACQPEAVEVERTVEVTVITEVEKTVVVKETVEVPVTRIVTATPTNTPEPTPTPEAEEAETRENAFAANYVVTQEQGEVEIEIIRVLCEDIAEFRERELEGGVDESTLEPFESSATACEFVLRVTNNTDGVISVYPDQGQVVVNGEQIEPFDFFAAIGPPFEDISGDLHAGVTRIGGFWFGVRRSTVDEIDSLTYIIDASVDENWDSLGEDYRFEIDTSGWEFEPIPDDVP